MSEPTQPTQETPAGSPLLEPDSRLTVHGCKAEDGVVIDFGSDWIADGERIYHHCGPDVRALLGDGVVCECGAVVPRIVEAFRSWLVESPARADRRRGTP